MKRAYSPHRGQQPNRPVRRPALLGLLFFSLLVLVIFVVSLAQTTPQPALAQGVREPTPLPLYALPDARIYRAYSSGSIALASDNLTLVAANQLNNTVAILVPANGRVNAEVTVGQDPRNVAITPDGARALVSNRGDGTLSVVNMRSAEVTATIPVGLLPYGVVSGDDGWAYVALQGSGEIAEVDLATSQVTRRFAAPDFPSGLALWGDFLYVTHFWTGEVSLIYIPNGQLIARGGAGRLNGVSQSITLDITRGIAYVPQSLSNPSNRALTYDSAVFPVVNVLSLGDLSVQRSGRIALDQADRPVNMPFALALDRFAGRLYVVSAGSNSLSVIDLATGRVRGHLEVGSNPRGVLLNRDNTLLYVHNAFDQSVTTIRTQDLTVLDVLPISSVNTPTSLLFGSQLFYSTTDRRTSLDGWLSCANCHFDGLSDGQVWSGFSGVPRNTPLLLGVGETAPYSWSGGWDELADIEIKLRSVLGGSGLTVLSLPNSPLGDPHSGLDPNLDGLVSYLQSLRLPNTSLPSTIDAAVVARGEAVFEAQNCASCHSGPAFTHQQSADVGTGEEGQTFDTPSLRWLTLSAPYFHDGRAATLYEVFYLPGTHQLVSSVSPADLEALVAYLRSIP